MKIEHFYEPVLGINCYFVYKYDPDEALKKLKKLNAISKEEDWEGLGFKGSENGKTVEYLKDNLVRWVVFVKDRNYSTAVHEAVHLVNMAFNHKGIKGDYDNDEYYAYYVAYWYSKFEKIMNK